jgi:RNA polymerase sigma-70 factor, ECF subfamily
MSGPADGEPVSFTPEGGGPVATDLFPRVYQELRGLAQQHMAGERRGHTLQATALVNEAYMRLLNDPDVDWSDHHAFYFAAAQAMRRILIEHARARSAAKRGGGRRAVEFSNLMDLAEHAAPEEVLAFDDALLRLEKQAPRAATIVRLRFYSGLSVEHTALALDISARTVNREWTFARAWLYQELADGESRSA